MSHSNPTKTWKIVFFEEIVRNDKSHNMFKRKLERKVQKAKLSGVAGNFLGIGDENNIKKVLNTIYTLEHKPEYMVFTCHSRGWQTAIETIKRLYVEFPQIKVILNAVDPVAAAADNQ